MGRYNQLSVSVLVMALGLTPWGAVVEAASAETAPADLVQTLGRIETAANAHDLEAVMGYYSEAFTSDTGFDHAQLRQTLDTLWQQYSTLTYEIELLSWEALGTGGYTIETLTRVNGVQVRPERRLSLSAEITSRQRLENGQIAFQEVLSETNRLVSGMAPPTLQVQLPTTLTTGQTFTFDTVVVEPLEGRSLMGVAVDEGVTAIDFFKPRPVVFDVLSAGGLYKLGTAADAPDQRWISAVIIREDGLVVETRRVQVTE
ncbi:MAG: nuclear transport factor 2 family protein [Leptolyngbyaceae cyanobacterium SM2_5_2]|nr:nuclear transport factor 2 family protein [Leptolyngbyaceae cyanobacterium SM2_5_2]